MKNIFTLALCLLMLSCQQVSEENPDSQLLVKFTLNATTIQREVEDWEDAVNSDGIIHAQESKSRATEEAVTRMTFAILDKDGNKVIEQEKPSTESGYMSLSAELPKGTYQLIAFGHNGSSNATVNSDGIISLSGNKLTDSFLFYDEISLSELDEEERNVVLERCVSKLCIKHTDTMPKGVASVELSFSEGGNSLDAKTGYAPEACSQTITINIPASVIGEKGNSFTAYTFLTEEETSMTVTATAKDASGNTIISHTIENVPMEINAKTTCTGLFFHSNQSIEATINTSWKEDKEIQY